MRFETDIPAPRFLLLTLVCMMAVLGGCLHANAASAAELLRVEPEFAASSGSQDSYVKARTHVRRTPTTISLESAPMSARRTGIAQTGRAGIPKQIGYHRDVPQLASAETLADFLSWEPLLAGGYSSSLRISSPQAIGVRMGLRVYRIPPEALVRFHAPDAATTHEVSGREILAVIQQNLSSGDNSEEAHTYWSPIIDGSDATLEIEIPPGIGLDQIKIAVPRISHLFQAVQTEQIGESNSCNLDATCHKETWEAMSNATARVSFTEAGDSYWCTGILLADSDTASSTPYFISANHCISNQTVASTVQTTWFYRASSCNSGTLDSASRVVAGGASLLYASSETDTSFMRLNGAPPTGAVYAGWSLDLPSKGTPVTGIHHPRGDLQKIGYGTISDYQSCVADGDGNGFSCVSRPTNTAAFLEVAFSSGNTEPGSSGSGLFLNGGYLVGTLYGGGGICGGDLSDYGRFDLAYNAALRQWLNPGNSSYLVSIVKGGIGTGVVTSSPTGISCGLNCAGSFPTGTSVTLLATAAPGSIFSGWSGPCSGTGACVVSAASANEVTARFELQTSYRLSVSKAGAEFGTVSSNASGIDCGFDCSEIYTGGTSVTLSAIPAVGAAFAGWSGACTGNNSCVLAMDADKNVLASFAKRADDGFPRDGILPATWSAPIASNAAWTTSSDDYFAGGAGLKSGRIGNNQKSEIAYAADFPKGSVVFARKVSSERNYDFLEFSIDGVVQARWSGIVDWSVVSYPLSAGSHTLLWRYVKDDSASSASDAAWIDSVAMIADGLWVVDAENKGQPGRGFQIEIRNAVMAFTYYGYGSDTNGLWALSSGAMSGNTYSGSMNLYRDGTALGDAYRAATAAGSAGTVRMDFNSPTKGSITFPGEATKAISKFDFSGTTVAGIAPENGLWVINEENNGQPGRGFQIEQHGGALILTYFGYGQDGENLWALSTGEMSGNGYSGSMDRYRNGSVLGGSYAPASTAGSAGQVSVNFTSPTTGTITFPGETTKTIGKFSW